ncbi:carbohydrate ABC transporter permease [Fusibacter bizertensis]
MGKYNEFLYDDIGNEYARKNLYLLELAKLQSKLKIAKAEEKSKIKSEIKALIRKKKNHPYNLELSSYKSKEKNFLTTLNAKKKVFLNGLNKPIDAKLKNMNRDLFISTEKADFYKPYVNLTHEAALAYERNCIIRDQLPEIIEKYKTTKNELTNAKMHLNQIDSQNELKIKSEIKMFAVKQNEIFKDGKLKLKEKKHMGLISDKALKNGIIELKKKRREAINLKSYQSDKKSTRELIHNKKYILGRGIKRELNVLKSNISDLRRKTPVELTKTRAYYSVITVLFPGLGQLLNRQLLKAILFAFATLFIYGIAIPYALGFGNYQGSGISGLITLAEGAKKIDKSLIFMIEGIVAIFLIGFAVVLLLLSYFDVKKVEKDAMKGIRPRNWFETYSKVGQEGFPYLVSLPALVLTVFIVLVPITTTVMLSFTGMDPKHQSKFTWFGIENYKLIATGSGLAGSVFWSILGWTIVWTICATSLAILVGFMLAIIANNDRIKGKTFFRVVYLLPWAVPAFITIMFFSIMFSQNGSITTLLDHIFHIQLTAKTDPFYSRVVLILLQTWLGSSYIFLLSTGVLQAIPGDLYEAAQIDGASEWQKLKRITIPIVLFQTAPLLVGQYTFNFNNFSIIYLFNGGGPFNPSKYGNLAGSTDLLISYIYKLTMENQYQSIGAAITIVISLGLMIFAFIGFKNSKAFKEERL